MRGHRYFGSDLSLKDFSRHISSPKVKPPAPAPAPAPDPKPEDAETAAAKEKADARMRRGKRATIIAGKASGDSLGQASYTAGATKSVLGG